jgi:hypothetical protein
LGQIVKRIAGSGKLQSRWMRQHRGSSRSSQVPNLKEDGGNGPYHNFEIQEQGFLCHVFLVTSRHVVIDKPSKHFPNRIEIELHTDPKNLTCSVSLSLPLYRHGKSVWRQGNDNGGEIDVAVIELERATLPHSVALQCFKPKNLQRSLREVEVGAPLLIVGFPLGFHDALHHLPVVRQAVIAWSFGLRFQGMGYFLTDARTHRGTSGAPVVMHSPSTDPEPP